MKMYPQPDSFKKIIDNDTNTLFSKNRESVMNIYPQPDSFKKIVDDDTNISSSKDKKSMMEIYPQPDSFRKVLEPNQGFFSQRTSVQEGKKRHVGNSLFSESFVEEEEEKVSVHKLGVESL